jgi:hypothetical protein
MILEDVSGRNRGEQRDDDDDDDIRIISRGVNTPSSLERTQVFSVLFPPVRKFKKWIRDLKVAVPKVRAEKLTSVMCCCKKTRFQICNR